MAGNFLTIFAIMTLGSQMAGMALIYPNIAGAANAVFDATDDGMALPSLLPEMYGCD